MSDWFHVASLFVLLKNFAPAVTRRIELFA